MASSFRTVMGILAMGFVFAMLGFQNCERRSLEGEAQQSSNSNESQSTPEPTAATLYIAVDNAAFIYLNNKRVGAVFPAGEDGTAGWIKVHAFPINVQSGTNTLAIMALNDGKTQIAPGGGPAAMLAAMDLGNGRYIVSDSELENWKVSAHYFEKWHMSDFDDSEATLWQRPKAYGRNGDSTTAWSNGIMRSFGSYLLPGFPTQVANQIAFLWTATNSHNSDGTYASGGPVDNTIYFRLKFTVPGT